jgi:hypothetical protein
MNGPNPLDSLKDIHLPQAVSAWPPAPGWWILTILSVIALSWIVLKVWKNYQHKHLFRVSNATLIKLHEAYLEHKNSHLLIQQYSLLLRRIALSKFPRQQVASLTGQTWLNFLDETSQSDLFNSDIGALLINAPYQKPSKVTFDIDALTDAVKSWIKAIHSTNKLLPLESATGDVK